MKTDLYTKTVLTVIAVSLAIIALRHSIPSAFAQPVRSKNQKHTCTLSVSGQTATPLGEAATVGWSGLVAELVKPAGR